MITLAAVVFLAMAMSSTAFAQYEDVQVVSTTSDSYAYGTVGAQLYYNSKGVWTKQVKLYNGTPQPGYDNPVWAAAEAMTQSNTTSSSSNVRVPSPHIFAADATTAPAVSYTYKIYGRSDVVALVAQAFTNKYNYQTVITDDQVINGQSGALVWSTSGMILFLPVTKENVSSGEIGRLGDMIAAFIANDVNLGNSSWKTKN